MYGHRLELGGSPAAHDIAPNKYYCMKRRCLPQEATPIDAAPCLPSIQDGVYVEDYIVPADIMRNFNMQWHIWKAGLTTR